MNRSKRRRKKMYTFSNSQTNTENHKSSLHLRRFFRAMKVILKWLLFRHTQTYTSTLVKRASCTFFSRCTTGLTLFDHWHVRIFRHWAYPILFCCCCFCLSQPHLPSINRNWIRIQLLHSNIHQSNTKYDFKRWKLKY